MKIFRMERFLIEPAENQTANDIKNIINKTHDLTVFSHEDKIGDDSCFIFTVKRKLEWYPDTIK